MNGETLILCIVLRQSLHADEDARAHYAANAVQHLLLKYFTLQVLAVKTHQAIQTTHVADTTSWLASHSKKSIISVSDELWDRLRNECAKDSFCLKDLEDEKSEVETTLVLWPTKMSCLPEYLKAV